MFRDPPRRVLFGRWDRWQDAGALRYHEDGAMLPDVEQGKRQRENQ